MMLVAAVSQTDVCDCIPEGSSSRGAMGQGDGTWSWCQHVNPNDTPSGRRPPAGEIARTRVEAY